MKRREFLGVVGGAAAWPMAARAQQPKSKAAHIGYLGAASASGGAPGVKALETGFRDLGYVEGKSYVIEYRWANGKREQLVEFGNEFARMPVDVIIAPTTGAALAAKKATATIPIVFATVAAPVELGLVDSLARPGGNVTGLVYFVSPLIIGKQLQLLKEIRAQVSRVAVLWKPSEASSPLVTQAKKAAGLLGMQLRVIEARGPDDFEDAFRTMTEEHTDALLVLPDPILSEHRAALGRLALEIRLPMMVGSREDLAVGCLMAYGASRADLIRRAAGYVDKILKGSKAADLPVEQPTKFELLINLATARALDLSLPSTLLAGADEVIE
jgi:putative ABC transport system substrate-binding protein